MSDTNNTEAAAAGAEQEAAPFDQEFAAFLGHTFNDEDEDEQPSGEDTGTDTTTAAAGDKSKTAPAGEDKIEGASGNDTTVSPNEADTSQQASGDDEVDPALLAAMAGLVSPAAGNETITAPAGQTGEDTTPAADAGADFTPFTPTFDLPPAIVQGLFEAEDTETRQKALVSVLSAFGNTITSVVDKRVDEKVKAFVENHTLEQQNTNLGKAVQGHFYGKYSELAPYKPAVVQAFKVIAERNPGVAYTDEIAAQVAALARAALKQSGIKFETKTAPAQVTPKKASLKKAPGSGFDAGAAARSGGLGQEPDAGPGELVEQMRDFGFG